MLSLNRLPAGLEDKCNEVAERSWKGHSSQRQLKECVCVGVACCMVGARGGWGEWGQGRTGGLPPAL